MANNMKTAERLAMIETDIKYIKQEISEVNAKIDKFVERADKHYASKLTEKIVYGLCGMVLIAFVTKLLNLW